MQWHKRSQPAAPTTLLHPWVSGVQVGQGQSEGKETCPHWLHHHREWRWVPASGALLWARPWSLHSEGFASVTRKGEAVEVTPEPGALQENKQSRHVEQCQPPVNSNIKSWLAGNTRPCRCGLLNGVVADTGPQTQWACSQSTDQHRVLSRRAPGPGTGGVHSPHPRQAADTVQRVYPPGCPLCHWRLG